MVQLKNISGEIINGYSFNDFDTINQIDSLDKILSWNN